MTAPRASAPRAIGPYTILETVDERAFTVTYRAEQKPLGRTVLIKTRKPTVSAGSPFAAGIEREATVLARLDHEGIVRIHDYVDGPDAPYLVLEDVRAVPLDDVIGRARRGQAASFEYEVAAAIALATARALGHAHERGVVHRALRTAVIAIAPRGRVILTDLSAADTTDATTSHLPSIPEPIEAGETFGRPDFMAPEQILGETAGPASDVWSLGVLCHVLLTGARPFDAGHEGAASGPKPRGGEAGAGDPRAIAQRIRTAPPAPLPRSVPEELARVVARCLAKDPGDRYPDARAVAAALEEAVPDLARLPVHVLVSRALAAADLGDAIAARAGASTSPPRAPAASVDVVRTARALAVVLLWIVAGAGGLRLMDDPDAAANEGVAELDPSVAPSKDRGQIRVVAKPWAEIYVDGELVDTTPVGRPIPVTPGRHFVTFRHPNAPDEQRSIKIAAGQSVFLDVTMRVDRGDAGARVDAGAAASP